MTWVAIAGWLAAAALGALWLRAELGWESSRLQRDSAVEAWKLALVQRDDARRRVPIFPLTAEAELSGVLTPTASVPNQDKP